MAAIEDSRVAIIVFSENYASSTWCLSELVKILDCKRDGQIEKVLPVFYMIDPSDVRKQANTYSQAFKRHEERFKNDVGRVQRWRAALTEASYLIGWDQRKVADGHESDLIKDIVEAVLAITNPGGCLHVAKFPTGLDSHVDAICGLLNERGGSDVVRTIGIYGPGGIGKTTIAKAVFNIMSRNFEGSCFLADVREVSSERQGSLHLQKQLISDILKREGTEIHNEHQGINMINKRLRGRRVLIVFDDVGMMTHLDKLVGSFDGFCPGSRIILTTRDEHLLTELDMDEKYKYRVERMDDNESLRLFCRHAFKQDHPSEGYDQLSEKVVHYAGGLPSALVILGSILYKRGPIEWECQLQKLEERSLEASSGNIKMGYDALNEFDQSILLDIPHFFNGWDEEYANIFRDAVKKIKEGSSGEHNKPPMRGLTPDMRKEMVHLFTKKTKENAHMTCGASSSGASSSSGRWKYDVFLSFSGEDTRKNFTDHLFNALVREDILTFRDNDEIKRGEHISSELMAAIENSRVAIIVFSEKYASSSWCLDELVKILDCKRDGRTEEVLPVFYRIDPSDVRKQRNTYSQAFMRHEERFQNEEERVKRWRAALTEAANLSGWDQREIANGHEAELIKKIVEEMLKITKPECLDVAKYPIGLDFHKDGICRLLNEGGSDVVHTIGIYGPGGIGKSTIAKAVFNMMTRNFDGRCFLADLGKKSSQQQGFVHLQKQLLSAISKRECVDIHNEDQGINIIRKHLCNKKVFIILDDVTEMKQLEKLVHGVGFCPGSLIILTTRNEHLLTELVMDEKYKYKVEVMDENESLQLLSCHAFKQDHPSQIYEQLSKEVVRYAGGLPLALVTLGSSLCKRSPDEWECELKKLKEIPNREVSKILKISYDLLDEFEQSIFLDISCFFIGLDKDYVSIILDACYPSGKAAIKKLKERSLVTIDEDNNLCMHDLIRDMGKEIVRRESRQKPGERSRVWNTGDTADILRDLSGTDAVKGFQLTLSGNEKEEKMTTNGFSRMPNLRLLRVSHRIRWVDCPRSEGIIDWEHPIQEGVILFKELVWVSWTGFPFKYIPKNFHLGNLVILEMRMSKLEEIWKGTKNLKKLKVLNLSWSPYLEITPDFSGLQNLERLNLSHCQRLVEVHKTIHFLKKLVKLELSFCQSLRNLPSSINELKSLEILDVSYCSKRMKHSYGVMRAGAMSGAPSFKGLSSLKDLNLASCGLTDDDIASVLQEVSLLESLDLSRNIIESLPMLPSSLRSLLIGYCHELKRLPHLSNLKQIRGLDLTGCENVTEIDGLNGLKSATIIDLRACFKLETSMKKRIFQDISKEFGDGKICDIFLPGNVVPNWLGFQNDGCRVIVELRNMEMRLQQQGLIIYSTFPSSRFHNFRVSFHVEVFNNSRNSMWEHDKEMFDICEEVFTWVIKIPDSVWKSVAARYENGDTITVSAYCVWEEAMYDQYGNLGSPSEIRLPAEKIGFHI